MKNFKYLAMLFAAFALSFTFAACGDDDDDDDNGTPDKPVVITPNIINLDGNTFTVKYGWAERHQANEDGKCMYKITLQSLSRDFLANGHPTRENPLHFVCISFLAPAADALPEGTHQVVVSGDLNATPQGGLNYYTFMSTEQCGQMVVTKNGRNAILTINPLVINYTKYDDCNNRKVIESDKTVKTTFAFSGELPLTVLRD